MQKKYFLYVNLWGDDGVGPILIYKYEQGAFTKVFDGNKLSDKFGYWGSIAIQSVDKNKIKIRLSSMSYAVASIELEAKLKYKDGKLVLASKMCKVKNIIIERNTVKIQIYIKKIESHILLWPEIFSYIKHVIKNLNLL